MSVHTSTSFTLARQRCCVAPRSHARPDNFSKGMTRSCCARCNLGRSSVGQHQLRSRQAGQVAQQRRAGKAYSPVIKAEAQDVRSAGSWRSAAASSLLQILAAATILAQPSPAWAGEVIQGTPRVADGDTLQIEDKKIRLFGFDAPEKAQLCKNAQGGDYSCGVQSGEALQHLIGSNPVRCEVRNQDQYGRNVSSCSVLTRQGPQDIGTYMVSNGYAVAYRQYGKDYIAAEDQAHQAHKGMWQGKFQLPADWRKDQKIEKLLADRSKREASGGSALGALGAVPQSLQSSPGPDKGCKIKGNINAKGDKIYHVPGSQYYEKTQIDLPEGERWFCTEEQAKQAGWRSAQ